MSFKPPKDFDEYIERFPDWHRKWLMKHHYKLVAKPEDFDDAAQYLLLETLRKDRISKYDSAQRTENSRDGKDSVRLFLHWMGQCFANDMTTLFKAKHSGKRVVNESAFSIDGLSEYGTGHGRGTERENFTSGEILTLLSQPYRHKTERAGEMIEVQAQIEQFRRFVAKYRPELVPSLDNLDRAPNVQRTTLALLARQMVAGRKPSPKRKPYKRHKPYVPRHVKWSPEQLEELAAKGLKTKEAAEILGCSDTYVGDLTKRFFGTNWKGLVRLQQQEKSVLAGRG